MDRLLDSAMDIPVNFLKRKLDYFSDYEQNVGNLARELEVLEEKINTVQKWVYEACRKLEVPTPEVEGWLIRASQILDEGRRIAAAAENMSGLSEWSSRSRLSQEAAEKADEAMRHRLIKFDRVSHVPPPPVVEPMPITGYIGGLAGTESCKQKVMKALQDDETTVIGVYGMGGVGKTTLMKSVNNELQGSVLFKKVIMVTVSSNPDWKRVQDGIAERLGLKLEPESALHIRANRLSQRLKEEKPFLVIFDDVWRRFEMVDVGVTEHKDCKIILTTRMENICRQMGTQRCIQVLSLSKEDSWILFERKAGDVVLFSTLRPIAEEIVRKCGGSPLAIVTLGSSLRAVCDEIVWQDALTALKEPKELEYIMPEVVSSVRFSFDHLSCDEIKLCFLFCSLFPEDYNIELHDMRMYGLKRGFLKVDENLDEAWNRLLVHVKCLKASSLLLDGNHENSVKMHDIVRDAALSIGSKGKYRFFTKAGVGLREWLEREELEGCKAISLMNNRICKVPDQPQCSQIEMLLLQNNESYFEKIPDAFFERMKTLLILDLSNTGISSLPPSLLCLMNLQTLCLNRCRNLLDISIVGSLKKLEILCLRESNINKLPEEIGGLSHLKLLDLSRSTNLETVPQNVISRLSRLQELYMGNSFHQWEIGGSGDGSQASFGEVASLACLTVLHLQVENVQCLSHDIPVSWQNLKKFSISFNKWNWTSKYLRRIRLSKSISISNWVKTLLESTEELTIVECWHLRKVEQLDVGTFKNLESLSIEECSRIECVVEDPRLWSETGRLKELHLKWLSKLGTISRRSLPICFRQLSILTVSECGKLKYILSNHLLPRLDHLEILCVHGCKTLQEVFRFDVGRRLTGILPRLRELILSSLYDLRTICAGEIPLNSLPKLEQITVEGCSRLSNLFSPALAKRLSGLGELNIWNCEGIIQIISDEQEPQQIQMQEAKEIQGRLGRSRLHCLPTPIFPNLRKMEISFCGSFTDLFSWSLAMGLQQLEELHVFNCIQMICIVTKQDSASSLEVPSTNMMPPQLTANQLPEPSMNMVLPWLTMNELLVLPGSVMFPRLTTLRLLGLPNLTTFCKEIVNFGFPCLEYLQVIGCQELKRLPLGPESAPNLKEIQAEVAWYESLEWDEEAHQDAIKSRLQPLFKPATLGN